MSVFRREIVRCPDCGHREVREVACSVNGARSPDLRAAILDSAFQHVTCPACGGEHVIGHPFTYIDVGRRQWIGVHGRGDVDGWRAREPMAREAWASSAGPDAPPEAQAMFGDVRIRTVFGVTALREKLLLDEHGLDDGWVEVLKLRLSLTPGVVSVDAGVELRLVAVDGDDLWFVHGSGEGDAQTVRVPRGWYDELLAAPAAWEPLRAALTADSFVDVTRMVVAGDEPILL